MKTWEFEDYESGEEFFVEAPTEEKAIEVAKEYFGDPHCYGEIDEVTADRLGYDTYQKKGDMKYAQSKLYGNRS